MNDKLLTDCKNKQKFTLCQFPFIHLSLSKPSMPFLNKVKFTFKRIYLSMRACNKLKSLPLHYIHRSEMRAFSSVPLVSVITAVIRSFESTSITQGRIIRNTRRREGGEGRGWEFLVHEFLLSWSRRDQIRPSYIFKLVPKRR